MVILKTFLNLFNGYECFPGCVNIFHVNYLYLWRSEDIFDPMNSELQRVVSPHLDAET